MLQLAQISDHKRINELAFQIHGMHVGWRPDIFQMPEELFSRELLEELINKRQMYVANVDGAIIGYVMIAIRDVLETGFVRRKVLNLEQICVDENCRGQGFGKQIMEDVHALSKAFGCTDLQLTVYPQNDDAVAFYQKYGFTIRYIGMQRKV